MTSSSTVFGTKLPGSCGSRQDMSESKIIGDIFVKNNIINKEIIGLPNGANNYCLNPIQLMQSQIHYSFGTQPPVLCTNNIVANCFNTFVSLRISTTLVVMRSAYARSNNRSCVSACALREHNLLFRIGPTRNQAKVSQDDPL